MTRARDRWGLLVLLGLVPACFTDAIEPTPSGEDTGAQDSDGSSGGAGEGNLLENASFESWSGDAIFVWHTTNASVEPATDDPVDGATVVRVSVTSYGDISQTLELPTPLPAGTRLRAEVSARHVADDLTNAYLAIELTHTDPTLEDVYTGNGLPAFPAQEWVSGAIAVEAAAEVSAVRVAISLGQGDTPQTLDFDAALLVIEP